MGIFVNRIKTAIIIGLIFSLLSIVIYYISYAMGFGRYAVVISLAVSTMTSVFSYWNSDKIVIKMNGAYAADPVIHREAFESLNNVCASAGIETPKLFIMNDPSPNAFATGRNPKNAVVCLTTGIIEKLDRKQLEGVIAHEVAHIKNYDILLSTVASVMIGVIIMASDLWSRSMWFSSRRRNDDNSGNGIFAIIGLLFVIIAPIAGQLLRLSLSRNREYLADSTGVSFTGNPEGLASALEIIGGANVPLKTASKATANMFISDPMYLTKKVSNLFSTHPPISERVRRLRSYSR